MSHKRVIPRDFFNEAKLLKCLGRFQLLTGHDVNKLPREFDRSKLVIEFDHEPFWIRQRDSDGALFVSNYNVFLDNDRLSLYVPYNSKETWPLFAEYHDGTYYVFDEEGNFMPNFGVIK